MVYAHGWSQIDLLCRNSGSGSEVKVLQEGGEEDEELHLGQALTGTSPATCEREREGRTSERVRPTRERIPNSHFLLSRTCRKRHEGVSLDKLPIFVQEVGGMKGVRTLPLGVVAQDRCQERIHCGSLKRTGILIISTVSI